MCTLVLHYMREKRIQDGVYDWTGAVPLLQQWPVTAPHVPMEEEEGEEPLEGWESGTRQVTSAVLAAVECRDEGCLAVLLEAGALAVAAAMLAVMRALVEDERAFLIHFLYERERREQVASVAAASLSRHFDSFYFPNPLTCIIVGYVLGTDGAQLPRCRAEREMALAFIE
jgi:hypothetical protein